MDELDDAIAAVERELKQLAAAEAARSREEAAELQGLADQLASTQKRALAAEANADDFEARLAPKRAALQELRSKLEPGGAQ